MKVADAGMYVPGMNVSSPDKNAPAPNSFR
jgi:hypothetical protein